MSKPTIVIISDGKPGHLAQSRGLADAIARKLDITILERGADQVSKTPAIDSEHGGLIIAAGRRTYSRAIQCARFNQLPAIALMNPGWLMRNRFDLCVIPIHDRVKPSTKVILTEGVLNRVKPAEDSSAHHGLILIGGPSKHHDWDQQQITKQIETILERGQDVRWQTTSSRRTPKQTEDGLSAIAERSDGRLSFTPSDATPAGWVADQLQRCSLCWVTEDSVSMVYEALTAGASVGLLQVPHRPGKTSRVIRGVASLVDRGWVTRFDQWDQGVALPVDRPPLAEADRVASHIIERWLIQTTQG